MENPIAHTLDLDKRTKDVIIQGDVSFQSMFLPEKVFRGLSLCGFEKPSPIQLKAIPLGRCGFDLIVKSKSGTGKTAVFSVIALEMVQPSIQELQVLILAPTREIAIQIAHVITQIGVAIEGLNVGVFIGGSPEKDDIKKLHNCHIAVGAPGRIKSLIKQNYMKTNTVKLFILDEVDKLMEKQFQNDINEIWSTLPQKKQVIALSATYPDELQNFLRDNMQSATQVNAEIETPLLLGLKQFVREVKAAANAAQEMKYKNEELLKLLACIPFTQCLIFSNYQTRAETVSITLNNHGWSSAFISAAQTQKKRLEVLDDLKNFKCRVLLSTDLTARGIDAANVDLIINYDVPVDVMTYLHRMGRAGRYGSKGICISLISGKKDLIQLRKFLGSIGGTNLIIPKLPENLEKNLDLWQINPKNLEQISGIIQTDEDLKTVQIKNEILEMKKKTHTDSNEPDIPQNASEQSVCEKNEVNETEDLLELMAKGQMCYSEKNSDLKCVGNALNNVDVAESLDDKKRKRTADVEYPMDILASLAKAEFDFPKMKDSNEKMNISTQLSEGNEQKSDDVNVDNKNKIFLKNKALFEVAKIMTYQTRDFDAELEKNVKSYFKSMKVEDPEKLPRDAEKIKRDDNLDDVFLHAYRFAIEGKHHWKQFIPENELNLITSDGQGETMEDSDDQNEHVNSNEYDEDYEDDEDFEENENFDDTPGVEYDENGKRIYAYEDIPNRMVWVPVEKSVLDVANKTSRINLLETEDDMTNDCVEQNPSIVLHSDNTIAKRCINILESPGSSNQIETYSSDIFNYDHFTECFRRCSDELWQNGFSFDSVEDFDNWFFYWQQRVHNVSDYVRQNLYVKEMSNYQNVKKFKK